MCQTVTILTGAIILNSVTVALPDKLDTPRKGPPKVCARNIAIHENRAREVAIGKIGIAQIFVPKSVTGQILTAKIPT
jgi:hypothetical protein